MGTSGDNRLVTFALVIGPISGNGADVLIGRDLAQEFGQHGSITNVATGDFDSPNLQRFLVDPDMYLTPDAAFGAFVLARIPLAFTFGFDPRTIDEQVQWPCGAAIR